MGLTVFPRSPTPTDVANHFAATTEVKSDSELADQIGEAMEDFTDRSGDVIQVCAGAYVREADGLWRFYLDPEWDA